MLGANARYLLGGLIADRFGVTFPLGTLVINVTGSLLIGVVLSLSTERLSATWRPGAAARRMMRTETVPPAQWMDVIAEGLA